MRIPDTVAGARKVILAGAVCVLLVLTAILGGPALRHEAHEGDPVVVPEGVRGAAPAPPDDPARGAPRGLRIPDLGLDVVVSPVRTGEDGVLVPPSDHTTVGWWSEGAQPGSAEGTVLITGHKVRAGGGAFDELATLEPGALLELTTARGRIGYEVVAVENYSTEQLATISDRLFSQAVVGRLVLVTCSDYFAGSYHGNTVVVAQPSAGGSVSGTGDSE